MPSAGKMGDPTPTGIGSPWIPVHGGSAQLPGSGWAWLHPASPQQGRARRKSFLCHHSRGVSHVCQPEHPRNRVTREGWELCEPNSSNPADTSQILLPFHSSLFFTPSSLCCSSQGCPGGNGREWQLMLDKQLCHSKDSGLAPITDPAALPNACVWLISVLGGLGAFPSAHRECLPLSCPMAGMSWEMWQHQASFLLHAQISARAELCKRGFAEPSLAAGH